jgi:hypothetical protein
MRDALKVALGNVQRPAWMTEGVVTERASHLCGDFEKTVSTQQQQGALLHYEENLALNALADFPCAEQQFNKHKHHNMEWQWPHIADYQVGMRALTRTDAHAHTRTRTRTRGCTR